MDLLLVIIVAISLSMDAFSLSLAYGTLGMEKKQIWLLALIVGIFHFFMPLVGMIVGNGIFSLLNIDPDFIVCIVLGIIGVQMIIESFKEKEEIKVMKTLEFFLFALAVSIDSFSVGLTLTNINDNYLLSALIFALCSGLFTFLGLTLGNKIKKLVGKISTIVGGIALIIIGMLFIF